MKIARGITPSGESVWAKVDDTGATPVFFRLEGNPYLGAAPVGEKIELTRLLAPVEPRALVCIGMNYREHTADLGVADPVYPVVVPKGLNALQHPGAAIELPRFMASAKVDYEGELAVVIGRDAKNVEPKQALDYVFGYTCANDVSARDWQFERGGGQWARGKQFDTFAPLGPWLVTADEMPDPSRLKLETRVNGETVQKATTASMIFTVPALIAFLSASTTLLAGTVLLTGTPAGVGMKRQPPRWLQKGDVVEVEIEGIGTLRNPVTEEITAAHAA
jgi:2-keto-4-pentenoate hydratase/2-oxohepta-3-ene-1,7-dioic acid hydratase in catechol pathway